MLDLLVILLVVTVLVIANGLFVAAEFAILAVPRAAVSARARAGEAAARTLHAILENPRHVDRYIATAQVGITFASLGLGMYGEHALAKWLHPHLEPLGVVQTLGAHAVATAVALFVLTYLHIVIGEMIPKALALQYAEATAFRLAGPMRLLKKAFFPLVVTLNGIGNGILRLMGIRRELAASRFHTAEELRTVVDESQRGGELRRDESRLLREVLGFSELNAGEAMMPRVRVTGLQIGASAASLRKTANTAPHTRYPVYGKSLDDIVGIVHVVDLLRLAAEGRELDAAATRRVPYVPETAPLDRVLQTLRDHKAHMAVVMDEHGGTAGIITIEDLVEELVGEIGEEPDPATRPVREGDGWLVDGAMRLDDLTELLHHETTHPDVDTLGGIVFDQLGRMPQVGDQVRYYRLHIEVRAVKGRAVARCLVRVAEES